MRLGFAQYIRSQTFGAVEQKTKQKKQNNSGGHARDPKVADIPMRQATTYTLYIRAGVAEAGEAPSGPTPPSPPFVAPPITSIGCLATFFGLVLSGKASDLQLVECAWESSSPSGALPCLERVTGDTRKLVAVRTRASRVGDAGDSAPCARSRDDMEAAGAILDAIFAPPGPEEHAAAGSAVDLALRSLIQSNILPGVSASLWGDAACYGVLTSSVYGGRLPWPLRWWLPRGVGGCSSSSSPEVRQTADSHDIRWSPMTEGMRRLSDGSTGRSRDRDILSIHARTHASYHRPSHKQYALTPVRSQLLAAGRSWYGGPSKRWMRSARRSRSTG